MGGIEFFFCIFFFGCVPYSMLSVFSECPFLYVFVSQLIRMSSYHSISHCSFYGLLSSAFCFSSHCCHNHTWCVWLPFFYYFCDSMHLHAVCSSFYPDVEELRLRPVMVPSSCFRSLSPVEHIMGSATCNLPNLILPFLLQGTGSFRRWPAGLD